MQEFELRKRKAEWMKIHSAFLRFAFSVLLLFLQVRFEQARPALINLLVFIGAARGALLRQQAAAHQSLVTLLVVAIEPAGDIVETLRVERMLVPERQLFDVGVPLLV